MHAACSTSFRHIDLGAGALAVVVVVVMVVDVEERSAILLHCRVSLGSAAVVVVVIVVLTACCLCPSAVVVGFSGRTDCVAGSYVALLLQYQ